MDFGPLSLAQAEGAILAHSVAVPGGRLRKGQVLGAAEVAALRAAGLTQVTVARLHPGDVHEDAAATRLAAALVPNPAAAGLRLTRAHTGRVNLVANGPGVARIAAPQIDAINAVDPMITVATVPRWQRMAAGGLVATIKIISYAVPERALSQAEQAARDGIALLPPRLGSAALVQTTAGPDDGARGHEALEGRLTALGVTLTPKTLVPHDTQALARALRDTTAEILFILTASATSDARDVAPAALRQAGGRVAHFGMPVDPGNLLFIGDLQGRPVVGLPGCARSPALNGADWVLERLICGVPVTPADIMGMGVGGLLKEIPTRPAPRRGPAPKD